MNIESSRKSKRLLYIVGICLLSLPCAITLVNCTWDTDSLWIIATGKEILENGIPYTNPFSINSDFAIVVQQWLFCVIAAVFDSLGYAGHFLFGILNLAVLFAATYFYLVQYKINRRLCVLSSFIFILLFRGALTRPRPEAVTVSMLLLECIALEKFQKTERKRWLFLLPALMVLEANLHSSMVLFHFAVAAAYVFSLSYSHLCKKNGLQSHWIPLLVSTASMVPAMFLNPYGEKGAMYLLSSLRCGTFKYVSIQELQAPDLLSVQAFILICMALLLWFNYKRKTLYNHQINMALGFGLIGSMMIRNKMFMYISMVLLVPSFLKWVDDEGLDRLLNKFSSVSILNPNRTRAKYSIKQFLMDALVPFTLIVYVWLAFMYLYTDFSGQNEMEIYRYAASEVLDDETLADFHDYICAQEENTEDVILFAGFNNGAYFEYLGYRNVFMDARPELLMAEINETANLLPAYRALICKYSDDYDYGESLSCAIQNFLDSYDFDYLVVDKGVEFQLLGFLEYADSGYTLVMESSENALYEKVGE